MQSFPDLGSLTPAEKDRRDRAIHKCAAVVDKDAELDPICRPEGGGGHQAPLGHLTKVNRRRGSKEVIRRKASIGRGGGVLSGAGERTA